MGTLLWQSTRPSPMPAWRPISSYGWWPPLFSWKVFFSPFLRFKPEFYLMVQKCWNRKEKHERDNKELFPTQSLNLMRLNYAISSESLFVRIFCSNLSHFFSSSFFNKKTTSFLSSDINCGPYEKMLLKHLLYDYERQNRFYSSWNIPLWGLWRLLCGFYP